MGDAETVKNWLSRYQENEEQLDRLIERIDALRSRLESPGSPSLSGMPHGVGYEGDSIGRKLAAIESLEEQAQEMLAKSRHLYAEINSAISRIKGRAKNWPDRKVVLEMKYLDLFSWEEINTVLWSNRPDFDDRLESYQRRTFRLHAEALESMANIVPDHPGQEIV